MKPNQAKIQSITQRINAQLAESGIVVGQTVSENEFTKIVTGCEWCPYSYKFTVWLPADQYPVTLKVIETFKRAGFQDVGSHSCKGIGAPAFDQIDAWV